MIHNCHYSSHEHLGSLIYGKIGRLYVAQIGQYKKSRLNKPYQYLDDHKTLTFYCTGIYIVHLMFFFYIK